MSCYLWDLWSLSKTMWQIIGPRVPSGNSIHFHNTLGDTTHLVAQHTWWHNTPVSTTHLVVQHTWWHNTPGGTTHLVTQPTNNISNIYTQMHSNVKIKIIIPLYHSFSETDFNKCCYFNHCPQNTGWPLSRWCEIPWRLQHFSMALGMLNVTRIMPVLVLNTCMDANMHAAYNKRF